MSMSTGKIVGIVVGVVLGGLIAIGGSIFMAYQSMYNQAITYENNIKRLNKDSEATLSAVTVKIQNAVGLNSQYLKGLKDVVSAAMSGRYGQDGSKATFQFIQEQNPTVSEKMFLKIQDMLDGGQTEFKISQSRKFELCTAYETSLETLVRGFFLKAAGFPKKDVEDMCKVISDATTQTAFKTGKQEVLIKPAE